MSERSRNFVLVSVMVGLAAVIAVMVISAPSNEDRVTKLGASIMCPVCQGEAIGSSPSQMARDMMALVEERVAGGASDAQIIDELLASYSGALLLDPPLRGPTIVLWIAPLVAFLVGLGVIVWWRRHPQSKEPGTTPTVAPSGRRAVGALVLLGSMTVVVMAVGFFLQEREGPAGGLAGLEVDSLDDVSNSTIEAVIATNKDHPQINGMRLALADRYFQAGDYRQAFPHFLEVASSEMATRDQEVTALVSLGWMAWDGNGEAGTAIGLLDQALALDPDSTTATYLKGRVLWCQESTVETASTLFTGLLTRSDLPQETRNVVENDLAALRAGEGCT